MDIDKLSKAQNLKTASLAKVLFFRGRAGRRNRFELVLNSGKRHSVVCTNGKIFVKPPEKILLPWGGEISCYLRLST